MPTSQNSILKTSAQSAISSYREAGGFDYPPRTSPQIRAIETQSRTLLRQLREAILHGPLADIPTLLADYDLLHRISYARPDNDFLLRVRLQAVDRWLRGDKTLTKTDIALLIADQIDTDILSLPRRHIDFYFATESHWVRDLLHYGTFPDLPLTSGGEAAPGGGEATPGEATASPVAASARAEARRRLTRLLRTDLRPYTPTPEPLLAHIRHLLDTL